MIVANPLAGRKARIVEASFWLAGAPTTADYIVNTPARCKMIIADASGKYGGEIAVFYQLNGQDHYSNYTTGDGYPDITIRGVYDDHIAFGSSGYQYHVTIFYVY